jgi:hypothetical protein
LTGTNSNPSTGITRGAVSITGPIKWARAAKLSGSPNELAPNRFLAF